MKKLIIFILLVCFCNMITGCRENDPYVRVVTGITVIENTDGKSVAHTFTQDQKTSHILNYLRLLDPYVCVPLSPETFRTDTYHITVTYSDGKTTKYNQIHNNYFQMETGSWKRIDPEAGERLQYILHALDDDI